MSDMTDHWVGTIDLGNDSTDPMFGLRIGESLERMILIKEPADAEPVRTLVTRTGDNTFTLESLPDNAETARPSHEG